MISCRKFFYLRVPKNFVGELPVFQRFFVSEKSMGRRGGGREYHDIPSKIFYRTLLKNFVEESFIVSLISVIENSNA